MTPPGPKRNVAFAVAGAVAIAALFAAYSNHFENGFHFDDAHVLVNNPDEKVVQWTPTGFELGFDIHIEPAGSDGGFADGDLVGVRRYPNSRGTEHLGARER